LTSDGSGSAREPAYDKLTPKLRGIVAALLPAMVKIGAIRTEDPGALRLAPERGAAGAKPTPNGSSFGPDRGGNALERHPGRPQPRSFLIGPVTAKLCILAIWGDVFPVQP
jgi:hypothetical protein